MASRPGRLGYDSQLTNSSDKSTRIYRDLDLFFGKKGTDSDVSVVEDIQAVKRSIKSFFKSHPCTRSSCAHQLQNTAGRA